MNAFEPYVRAWRARWAREADRDRDAAAEARRSLPDLVAILREAYGAQRVILVGSLAREDFREDSDVDLVVEGLPAERLFEAGAALERASAGRRVDLVPLESAGERFRERVRAEGVVLYDDAAA